MIGLTEIECSMMHVLTKRLGSISSPVVRSQLLLQMSAPCRAKYQQYHHSDIYPGFAFFPDLVLSAGIYLGQPLGEVPASKGTTQGH